MVHRAIGLLRMAELEEAYASAWQEWEVRGVVAVERLRGRVGTLPAPMLRQLDYALSLHLAL